MKQKGEDKGRVEKCVTYKITKDLENDYHEEKKRETHNWGYIFSFYNTQTTETECWFTKY